MALVTIVYVPTPDKRGPDVSRMEKVEDLPDEVARMMLNDGTAREPSEDELAAYRDAQAVEEKAGSGDLTKMLKADLLALAEERGVDGVDESMTKAAIVGTIEAHQAERAADPGPSKQVPGSDLSVGLPAESPNSGADLSPEAP